MIADRLRGLLGETRAATLANPPVWLQNALTFTGSSYAGKSVTPSSAMALVPFYSGVSMIAGSVGQLPMIVYRKIDEDTVERARDTVQWQLVHDKPNEEHTADEFWEMITAWLLTWGNAFAFKERTKRFKTIGQLIPIRPSRVEVGVDDAGRKFFVLDGRPDRILRDTDILHFRGLGGDGIVGYSPVQVARQMLGSQLALEEFTGRFWRNSAIPFGVLQSPNVLSDEAFARLKARWNELHEGTANAGKMAILEEGLEWKQTGMPLQDAQFLETQKLGDLRIAQLLGLVPPHRWGSDDNSLTYANVEMSGTEYVRYTIGRYLRRLEMVTGKDPLIFPPVLRLEPKFNVDALLRADTKTRQESYAIGWNKWITTAEIREREELPNDQAILDELAAASAPPAPPEPPPFPDADERRYRPDQKRGPDGRWVDEDSREPQDNAPYGFPPGLWDPKASVKFWPARIGQYNGSPIWKATLDSEGNELAFWFVDGEGNPHHWAVEKALDDEVLAGRLEGPIIADLETHSIAGYGTVVEYAGTIRPKTMLSDWQLQQVRLAHRKDLKDAREMLAQGRSRHTLPTAPPPDDLASNDRRVLLYGPPGAGKTSEALRYATLGYRHHERELYPTDAEFRNAVASDDGRVVVVRCCFDQRELEEWRDLSRATHVRLLDPGLDECRRRIEDRARNGWQDELVGVTRWYRGWGGQRWRPDQKRAPDGRWVDEGSTDDIDQVDVPLKPDGKPGPLHEEWEQAIRAWTGGGNFIEEMRANPDLPEAQAMKEILDDAPWKAGPTLYRGMAPRTMEEYELLTSIEPGDIIPTDLAVSFSSRQEWVKRMFLGPALEAEELEDMGITGETPGPWQGVLLEMEGGPVVSVKEWSNTPNEEEWVTGRDLEVLSVQKVGFDAWKVRVTAARNSQELAA